MENKDNLKSQVVSGLFWKFGERITAQFVSLVVSIILARVLSPEDFGTVSLVMVFITIANVFVSNGFGNALIQKKDANNIDFSSVLYINILVSFAIYFLIFIIAPVIADFYKMPVLCSILRVLGIRIIIASINSIQHAFVSRNMLFKRFFWSTLFGTIISGIVGVSLAYKGAGVWALVAQYLTNTIIDTFVLAFTIKWKPVLAFSWKRSKSLISFGWKLLCAGLMDTTYSQLRNLLIGKIYTPSDLAYYNQGDKYPQVIVVNVNTSIGGVLFPAMSKYQDNREKIKYMTRTAIQVSSYVIWPIMIGMSVVAEPFVKLLLTDKWLPCIPYLRIFCISYGLWPIHTANLQAINALGRSDLFLRLEIIKKSIGIAVLFCTIYFGPLAVAIGLIITGVISTFVNSYPNKGLLNYSYFEQLKDLSAPLVLSILVGACVYPISLIHMSEILIIIFQLVLGIVLYIFGSIISNQKGFTFIRAYLKGMKKK